MKKARKPYIHWVLRAFQEYLRILKTCQWCRCQNQTTIDNPISIAPKFHKQEIKQQIKQQLT